MQFSKIIVVVCCLMNIHSEITASNQLNKIELREKILSGNITTERLWTCFSLPSNNLKGILEAQHIPFENMEDRKGLYSLYLEKASYIESVSVEEKYILALSVLDLTVKGMLSAGCKLAFFNIKALIIDIFKKMWGEQKPDLSFWTKTPRRTMLLIWMPFEVKEQLLKICPDLTQQFFPYNQNKVSNVDYEWLASCREIVFKNISVNDIGLIIANLNDGNIHSQENEEIWDHALCFQLACYYNPQNHDRYLLQDE